MTRAAITVQNWLESRIDRSINAVLITGAVHQIRTSEIVRKIYSYQFALLFLLSVVLLTSLDANSIWQKTSFASAVSFWVATSICWIALEVFFLLILAEISAKIGLTRVFIPLIAAFSMTVTNLFGGVLEGFLVSNKLTYVARPITEFIKYYVVAQVFEVFFLVYFLPATTIMSTAREDDQPKSVNAGFRIGRSYYANTEVLFIRSAQSYVEIVHSNGTDTVRASLSSVAGQIGDEIGVQIHRSYWVAKAAIAAVTRKGGILHVRLVNGEELSVAKERNPVVEEWLALNGFAPRHEA